MTGKWPYPDDTPLQRARRIAQAYRQHLHTANPAVCATLDDMAVAFGQGWIVGQEILHDDVDAVTTREAADLAFVTPEVIRKWACTPHPGDPTRQLLPRYRRRGREMTYLVRDVRAAASLMAAGRKRRSQKGNLTTLA